MPPGQPLCMASGCQARLGGTLITQELKEVEEAEGVNRCGGVGLVLGRHGGRWGRRRESGQGIIGGGGVGMGTGEDKYVAGM